MPASPTSFASCWSYCLVFILLNISLLLSACSPLASVTAFFGENHADSVEHWRYTSDFYSPQVEAFTVIERRHTAPVRGVFPFHLRENGAPQSILSVDSDGYVHLSEVGGERKWKVGATGRSVMRAQLSGKQRYLALVNDLYIGIWDLHHFQEVAVLKDIKTRASEIVFDPATDALLIAGIDGRIYRWKWFDEVGGKGKERDLSLERYVGHASVVSAIAFHPRGRVFFSADWRGTLSAWRTYDGDLFEGQYAQNIFGGIFYTDHSERRTVERVDQSRVESLIASPRGSFLALGTTQGSLELWSIRGFQLLSSVDGHSGLVRLLAFSDDEKWLTSYGRDRVLRRYFIASQFDPLLDETNYELENRGKLSFDEVTSLNTLDKERIVVGLTDGEVQVLSIKDEFEVLADED